MSILNEKFDILYELSTTVSTESDYVEALRLIRDSLKRLIPSDAVLVFLDDRDQEKLIAPNPYNALESLGEDFIISYTNPLARELIVNKKSCHLNESQSTLIPSMKSELYIPLISPEEAVGCLYFGREHTATFSDDEIKCAEHAASLITQPVERIHQHSQLKRLQESCQQLQGEYLSLLQGLPNPAAIIDISQDAIVKANDRLCDLLNIPKERLIAVRFSDICSLPSPSSEIKSAEFADKIPVEMINNQKKRLKCQAYCTPLHNSDRQLCLFLPERGGVHPAKEDLPGVLLDSLMRIDFSSGLQTVITNLAVEVRNIVSVDYFSISLFDKEGEESISFDLSTAEVREFSDDQWRWHEIPDIGLGWVRFADTEAGQGAADSGRPQRMPFNLPIHNSLPLICADRYVGNCSIGRITKKPFDKEELKKLRQLAPVVAMILLTAQLHEKVDAQSGEISKLEALASYINSDIGTDVLMNIISEVREVLGASHADILWLNNPDSNGLFWWMPEIVQQYLSLQQMEALLAQLKETRTPLVINSPACFIDNFLKEHPPEEPMPFFQPFVITSIFTHDVFSACLLFVWRRDHFIQARDIKIIEILKNYIENTARRENSNRHLQERIEELENFVSTVSHDLKTPIQTVQNFATMIKEECESLLPNDSKMYLDRLSRNLTSMEKLITDLLHIARSDKMDKEQIETKQLVQTALESLEGLLKANPTKVIIDKNLPTIVGNKTGITQVFTNLLSNAIKATKTSKTPTVKVGYHAKKSFHEFYVQDNGCGISPDIKDKIFDPFISGQKSTGVGLAIVKKVIEKHGGEIDVESKPDYGSVFTFTIPKEENSKNG